MSSGWQIFVRVFQGTVSVNDVCSEDTVRSVKEKLQQKQGLPVIAQVLTYAGYPLEDTKTLGQYGILRESTLQLTLRQHYQPPSGQASDTEQSKTHGKESSASRHTKSAAMLVVQGLANCLLPKLELVLDDGIQILHSSLSKMFERHVSTSQQDRSNSRQTCSAFPPKIHSGELYAKHTKRSRWLLKPTTPNPWLARDGTILVSVGVECSGFTAAVARTYFLNPSSIQETQYHATLMALEAAVSALKPGASMAAPRSAAKRMLKHMGQDKLAGMLCQDIGACISHNSLYFYPRSEDGSFHASLLCSANKATVILPDSLFYVSIGFQGCLALEPKDLPRGNYALHIAETVLVGKDENTEPTVLTGSASSSWEKVTYHLQNQDCARSEEVPQPTPVDSRVPRMDLKDLPAPTAPPNRFLSLLDQTPALLSACTSLDEAMTSRQARSENRGPLKSIRLASRGGRAAASRAVTVFELTLDREPGRDMSKMVQLLDGACLKCFGVEVLNNVLMCPSGQRAVVNKDQPSLQAQQLRLFLQATKSALATVTSLRFKLPAPAPDVPPTDDPYGLSALAGVCPSVQHLGIVGSPAPMLLSLLGSKVTHFEIESPQMHHDTIEQLHELLPVLKELTISNYSQDELQAAICVSSPYNLSRLTGVQALYVPKLHIHSPAMWASFPPNLMRLSCAGVHLPPPAPGSLDHLQTLRLVGSTCTADALAGIFRSAPNLLHVESCNATIDVDSGFVAGELDSDVIAALSRDLVLLNDKHAAGITACPFSIIFYDCEHLAMALAGMPVLPGFTEVILEWVSVVTSSQVLDTLCSVFTEVETLEMSNSESLNDAMLMALLPMKRLKCLTLRQCPLVTAQGLTFLLCQLPLVKELNVLECEAVTQEQVELLQDMLATIGRELVLEFDASTLPPVSSSSASDSE